MEAALISHRAYSSICVFCGKGRALFTSDSVGHCLHLTLCVSSLIASTDHCVVYVTVDGSV